MPKKNPTAPRKRGFALMDPQRQREIASLGGKQAHLEGRAHVFTSEEARAAGRKGGLATKTYGRKSLPN
jgi:general stress protein YciG